MIYLASSWRNQYQSSMLLELQNAGFEVYDFKNPKEGNTGFSWREIEPDFEIWTTEQYIKILDHPVAQGGFQLDWNAMCESEACVLLLPSGRSAHIEAGFFVGANRPLFIYIPDEKTEPELMYKMATGGVFHCINDLLHALRQCDL